MIRVARTHAPVNAMASRPAASPTVTRVRAWPCQPQAAAPTRRRSTALTRAEPAAGRRTHTPSIHSTHTPSIAVACSPAAAPTRPSMAAASQQSATATCPTSPRAVDGSASQSTRRASVGPASLTTRVGEHQSSGRFGTGPGRLPA